MNDNSVLFVSGNKIFQIGFKVIDHIGADGMRTLSPLAPIRDRLKSRCAPLQAALGIIV